MDYTQLTVAQLKAKLTEIGLSTAGKKIELIARLEEHFNKEVKANDKNELTNAGNEDKTEKPKKTEVKPESSDKSQEKNAKEEQKSTLSEEELKKKRAERFGIPPSFEEKKMIREERFKTTTLSKISHIDDPEKILKRKERFGVISPLLQKEEELKKKKMREERFSNTK